MCVCVRAHVVDGVHGDWKLIIVDYPSTVFTEAGSQSNPELAAVVSLNSLLDLGIPRLELQ